MDTLVYGNGHGMQGGFHSPGNRQHGVPEGETPELPEGEPPELPEGEKLELPEGEPPQDGQQDIL